MAELRLTDEKYKEIVIDLLIDILSTNKDILDRLDSTYDYEIDENVDVNYNRVQIVEYLESKYGELKKPLLDFLKNKGIDKSE
ncbi:hypothetical protein GZ212_12470 [Mangrovimonas sp. CR14]|uniref:hypothetical protein n=1 Tax=Mangrovimonas sp. CR14 TaxID=2706120 RepID=UPI001421E605|nr:hypothetical protein [Mangrovimonas sp. CR14]NIK92969.1 hypothetical protein [Mangrovimonas sp. CR14]